LVLSADDDDHDDAGLLISTTQTTRNTNHTCTSITSTLTMDALFGEDAWGEEVSRLEKGLLQPGNGLMAHYYALVVAFVPYMNIILCINLYLYLITNYYFDLARLGQGGY
jgi:hypothetical protein